MNQGSKGWGEERSLGFYGHTNLPVCSQISRSVFFPWVAAAAGFLHRSAGMQLLFGPATPRDAHVTEEKAGCERAVCGFICFEFFSITFPKRTNAGQVYLVVWIRKEVDDSVSEIKKKKNYVLCLC